MGITKYLIEVQKDFEIYGETDDGWEEFLKDKEYLGFIAIRKNK